MSIPASERHEATGGRRGAGTRSRPGVALVIQHYPPFMAGAERQARLLAETLAACLGSSDVITTRFRPDLPLRTEEDGVRVRRLRTCSVGGLRHLVNFLSALVYFLRNGHRYTVVHAHCLSAFSLGAILGAQVRGCRTLLKVCSIGEAGETVKLRRHALGPLLWAMARRADTFIAPTPALVERLVLDGFPAERIVVLPNMVSIGLAGPIDEPMRAAARKDLGLAERPTILFVGRMADGKGLDTLMQAWGDVAAEHDAGLVLVGDGPEAGRVARWAREEGRARTVRLAGRQEHPEAFYRAADILAFPSQEETFGNVLVEAMAHGLAVVSTRVGVALDCLRHGDNGLLVPHAEPAELARAIDRLIRDVPLRERLGRAARREVVERFAPAPIARRHLKLYGLLDARRAAGGES